MVIFDVEAEFSFKNHFKPVPDPLGGGTVFQTADEAGKMTFVQKAGFFAVPAGYKGAVVLEVLHRAHKLRVSMVGEGKGQRSYNFDAPVEDQWFELSLPLADLKDRVAEGDRIVDVTVWIMPDVEGEKLPADAQMYLRRALLVRE